MYLFFLNPEHFDLYHIDIVNVTIFYYIYFAIIPNISIEFFWVTAQNSEYKTNPKPGKKK